MALEGLREVVKPPRSTQVVLPVGCNEGCNFCDQPSSSLDTLIRSLPEDDSLVAWEACVAEREERLVRAVSILDGLVGWGVSKVTFTGGEPTLFLDIQTLLKEAKTRDMETALATNGLNLVIFPRRLTVLEGGILTPNLLDTIARDECLDVIKLSLHGADAKTHDQTVRMGGSFAGVVLALSERQRYYPKLGAEVTCVVTRENWEQLEEIARLCLFLGVDQLTFNQIYPRGRGRNRKVGISFGQIQDEVNRLRDQVGDSLPLVARQASPSCLLVSLDGEVVVSYCPTATGTFRVGNLNDGNINTDWENFPLRGMYERAYGVNQREI